MSRKFISEQKRLVLFDIINKYVKNPVTLIPISVESKESFTGELSSVTCRYENTGKKRILKTNQSNVIGAIFDALVEKYSKQHQSLETIKFVGYSVNPYFKKKSKGSNSDAMTEVVIEVSCSSKIPVQFRKKDISVLRATIKCIFSCVEYYINSELCFKRLRFLIDEAEKRNRTDISSGYITDIAEIVKVTSYEDLV